MCTERKMIVTTGISLLTNYQKYYSQYLKRCGLEEPDDFSEGNPLFDLEQEYAEEENADIVSYMNNEDNDCLKKTAKILTDWVRGIQCLNWADKAGREAQKVSSDTGHINGEASAEIKSIYEYVNRLRDPGKVHVYLLSTDSPLSCMCAQVIHDCLNGWVHRETKVYVHYEWERDCIAGLQLYDVNRFRHQGISGLVNRMNAILGNYTPDEFNYNFLCISGGYKGIVPILTLIAQVYRLNLLYLYADDCELIELPVMPVRIKADVIIKYKDFFDYLAENEIVDLSEDETWNYSNVDLESEQDMELLIEKEDHLIGLNWLGRILYEKYKLAEQEGNNV